VLGLVGLFLLTGTLMNMSQKMMLQTSVPYLESGDPKMFNNPLDEFAAAFLSMALVGPFYFAWRRGEKRAGSPRQPLVQGRSSVGKVCLMAIGPALCFILATLFQLFGLALTSISNSHTMRGSIVGFTALQRYCYLGKKTRINEVVGVCVTMIAFCIVSHLMPGDLSRGVISKYDMSGRKKMVLKAMGIGFLLLAQFAQAWQTVIEEKLLHNAKINVCFLVSLEGVWGLLITLALFKPLGATFPGEGGIMNDHLLGWYLIAFVFYNIAGMMICERTDATTRNVIDALRILCVWILAILLYAVSPEIDGGPAPVWEKPGVSSLVEFSAFVIFMLGLFVGMFIIAGFEPPSIVQPLREDQDDPIALHDRVSLQMESPISSITQITQLASDVPAPAHAWDAFRVT